METMLELLGYTAGKDLRSGHILLIDKPLGWTSFNVVGKVRYTLERQLGLRGIKVGHAGTLDPLATGLMVICIGRATKLAQEYTNSDKAYEATFCLGSTTPSHDLETAPDGTYPIDHVTEAQIYRVAESFIGEQEQAPPLFSAKRINGQRAYAIARSGKSVQLDAVPIRIGQFDVVSIGLPLVRAQIRCSKGTYIRALARDFGHRLACGAHLCALRRVASGPFSVDSALSISEFEAWAEIASQSHSGHSGS